MKVFLFVTLVGISAVAAQRDVQDRTRTTTTPVPILRQVNKVNEDGSYTYGYENADGSFKIETKDVNGQVQGKYGYYDDAGTLREVEYGASKAGFYPQGTGINAPEVAQHREIDNAPTDGSYDPELYTYPYQYNNELAQQSEGQIAAPVRRLKPKNGRRAQNAAARQLSLFQQQQPQSQPQQQQQYYQQSQPQQQQQQQQYYQPQAQPQQQQQQYYQPQPQAQPQPNYYQQQPQAPVFNPSQLFQGHPARNINLDTGSYSVNYSG